MGNTYELFGGVAQEVKQSSDDQRLGRSIPNPAVSAQYFSMFGSVLKDISTVDSC